MSVKICQDGFVDYQRFATWMQARFIIYQVYRMHVCQALSIRGSGDHRGAKEFGPALNHMNFTFQLDVSNSKLILQETIGILAVEVLDSVFFSAAFCTSYSVAFASTRCVIPPPKSKKQQQ